MAQQTLNHHLLAEAAKVGVSLLGLLACFCAWRAFARFVVRVYCIVAGVLDRFDFYKELNMSATEHLPTPSEYIQHHLMNWRTPHARVAVSGSFSPRYLLGLPLILGFIFVGVFASVARKARLGAGPFPLFIEADHRNGLIST